jgi:hypothetical protein
MPAEPESATTEQPKHPISALTTYELRDERRRMENAIAFFQKKTPVPPVCGELQGRLDEVLAEQDERARIAAHG